MSPYCHGVQAIYLGKSPDIFWSASYTYKPISSDPVIEEPYFLCSDRIDRILRTRDSRVVLLNPSDNELAVHNLKFYMTPE